VDARRLVSTGLRLGRGTADRVVTIAGPRLGRLADQVVAKVRRPEPRRTSTFTPTKPAPDAAPDAAPAPEVTKPTPASVARNIAPHPPEPEPAKAKPKSTPGAKLPPRRATTS
jgi:hypothetical protein